MAKLHFSRLSVCGYTVKNEKLNNLLGSHIRPFQCLCGLKFIITQWANIVFIISHHAGGQKCTFGQTALFSPSVCGYTVKNEKLNNLLGSHIRPCQCLCGLKFIITQWANIVFIISHHAGGQKYTFGQTALLSPSVCGYTVKNEKLNNLLGNHIRPCQCLCGLMFIITQWANIVFIISHHAGGQKCTFGQTALFSPVCVRLHSKK